MSEDRAVQHGQEDHNPHTLAAASATHARAATTRCVRSLWLIALAWCSCGCGEEANVKASAFNGAYRVTSHTRSVDTCDQEGPAVPDAERTFGFVFRISSDPEDNIMMGAPCSDADACSVYYESNIRLKQRDGGFFLPDGDDAVGWSGRALALFIQQPPPQCFADHVDYVLTSPAPGRVRLEERHHVRPVTADGEDLCPEANLKDVAPCSSLEVIEGDRL
jgi:hypothetical protein